MQNIVLDTNSLIMSISAKGLYNRVWQGFLNYEYILCITNEIIEEYLEVMARNINRHLAESIVYAILTRENIRKVDPHYHFRLIKSDEDDNKFVDCAIAANATYIVTEDHHFNVLKEISFPAIDVINIEEFIKVLNAE